MIRVLLVDDHAVVRTGFRLLLQSLAEVSIVGEAESGEAACQCYPELTPDVVVMDLAMPGMGGLEALRRIREGSVAHGLAHVEQRGGADARRVVGAHRAAQREGQGRQEEDAQAERQPALQGRHGRERQHDAEREQRHDR